MAAALDGPLDPVEQADVSRHLRACVACRAVGSGYEADASLLRDIAAVAAPAWVAAIVLDSAAQPVTPRGRSWSRIRPRLIAALVGAAVLIAIVIVLGQSLR